MTRAVDRASASRGWRPTRRTWIKLVLLGIGVVAAGALVVAYWDRIDWSEVRRTMEQMDRGPMLVLMAVLPIFGFSIGVVYVVVGAVFGGWLGLAVVAGLTAIHLAGSHWIARSFLHAPVQRFLKRRNLKLPELPHADDAAIALMTALVPGIPYVARNYLLALSPIPFRVYFWVCWPVYVIRSGIAIMFGDLTGEFSVRRGVVLAMVLGVKLAICAWIIKRLRDHHRELKRASEAKRDDAGAERGERSAER